MLTEFQLTNRIAFRCWCTFLLQIFLFEMTIFIMTFIDTLTIFNIVRKKDMLFVSIMLIVLSSVPLYNFVRRN